MELHYIETNLLFNTPFKIAHGTRSRTPIVLLKITFENYIGYGEASMPPYLGESHKTVCAFLEKAKHLLLKHKTIENLDDILREIDSIDEGNNAAKASIDTALHDLWGKIHNKPLYELWDLNPNNTPYTTFTIGISEENELIEKIKLSEEFKILKIKLGSGNDKEIIQEVRKHTDKPIVVDVNQGWKDKIYANEMIDWLSEQNVLFVEQPLPVKMIDEVAWLNEKSKLSIIADESCKRLSDISKIKHAFSGINIKLMKSTGLNEAKKMIYEAKENDLKIFIGCMSETSCAVSAAAQLTPLAHWADLDGPLLVQHDYFDGVKFVNGKITLNSQAGIGVTLKKNIF